MVNDTQQIPAGYKQTDVGVIPEDWEVKELRDVCAYQNGKALESLFNDQDGYAVISIGNYSPEGSFVSTKTYIDRKYKSAIEKYLLKSGDLAMILNDKTSLGTILGRTLLISKNDEFVFNQRTMRIRSKSVQPEYLHHLINSDFIHKVIVGKSMPGTQIYINTSDVLGLELPIPVNSVERDRIIEVVRDIDSLISKLDQLIQKKKNIKQGAMQELLTGKRRLPGFSGEWVEKKLGDLIDLKNGYSFKSDNYLDGGAYSIVTIANVQRGYMDASHFNKIARLPNDIQAHQKLSINDLLISMTGNVGRVCRVTLSNCLLNQRVGKIESKGLNELYLFYLLNRSCFLEEMILKAQGGAQGNIGKNDILSYSTKITVNIDEQIAISRVLSDLDVEIDVLKDKRKKCQDIKQGMMQQLLTGKIRLI